MGDGWGIWGGSATPDTGGGRPKINVWMYGWMYTSVLLSMGEYIHDTSSSPCDNVQFGRRIETPWHFHGGNRCMYVCTPPYKIV